MVVGTCSVGPMSYTQCISTRRLSRRSSRGSGTGFRCPTCQKMLNGFCSLHRRRTQSPVHHEIGFRLIGVWLALSRHHHGCGVRSMETVWRTDHGPALKLVVIYTRSVAAKLSHWTSCHTSLMSCSTSTGSGRLRWSIPWIFVMCLFQLSFLGNALPPARE